MRSMSISATFSSKAAEAGRRVETLTGSRPRPTLATELEVDEVDEVELLVNPEVALVVFANFDKPMLAVPVAVEAPAAALFVLMWAEPVPTRAECLRTGRATGGLLSEPS